MCQDVNGKVLVTNRAGIIRGKVYHGNLERTGSSKQELCQADS